MTLDTDFVRLNLFVGTPTMPCKKLGLEWPPPERIYVSGNGGIREAREGDDETFVMVRTRCSDLDDKTADHPYIARGAEYHYANALPEDEAAAGFDVIAEPDRRRAEHMNPHAAAGRRRLAVRVTAGHPTKTAHASRWVCDRDECIQDAIEWAKASTHQEVYVVGRGE